MSRPGLAVKLTVLVVSAVVAGTAVIAVSSRGDLRAARRSVDTAWGALRPVLDARYQALAEAGDAVEQRLGAEGNLMQDLDGALGAWQGAAGTNSSAGRERKVAAANRLEGLAARLAASAASTPRLRTSAEVAAALAAVTAQNPGETGSAYNGAVNRYEEIRGGFPRRLVAGVLGFNTLRTLELPVS